MDVLTSKQKIVNIHNELEPKYTREKIIELNISDIASMTNGSKDTGITIDLSKYKTIEIVVSYDNSDLGFSSYMTHHIDCDFLNGNMSASNRRWIDLSSYKGSTAFLYFLLMLEGDFTNASIKYLLTYGTKITPAFLKIYAIKEVLNEN